MMRVGVAMAVGALGLTAGGAPVSAPIAAASPVPQRPDMPALAAQGIARVNILCLVVDSSIERLRLQERLCAHVRRIAAVGAPVPVETIGFGDPALIARGSLGVLVHAAVDRSGVTPMLILSMRPYRAEVTQTEFFGATPVAVPLGAGDRMPDAALAAALDQILPWRMATTR
jgi:hypothetical protein